MNQPEQHDYTVAQVAKLCSCSAGTVKNWIVEGRVQAYRLGGNPRGAWRIPASEVERIRMAK